MKTVWKIQDAARQLPKLIEKALIKEPQYIIRQGVETVVIISVKEYEYLISGKTDFKDFLLSCPKSDEEFEPERQKDFSRDIEL